MKRIGTILLLALLLAGCGASPPLAPPTPETHTISGEIVLVSDTILPLSTGCKGTGGYSDMDRGAPVTVKNEAGTIIATSMTGEGIPETSKRCRFPFFVTGVPPAAFYSIEVGRRGALTYSFAEMETKGWAVAFTLGS